MSRTDECLEVGQVKNGGWIVVDHLERLDYAALVDEALKKYEIKVVAVEFAKHPYRNKHLGLISFDSSLRNLTSYGPTDTTQKIEIPPKNSMIHCGRLTRELYKVLPSTPFRYTIYLRGYKTVLKQLVTGCLMGPYEKVTIVGHPEILDFDEMDFLLNFVKPDAYFEFNGKMTDDFKHEKAFQFKSFFYHHAEWITLEDLKSLRNHNVVRLGSTKFTSKDINKFLKYWTECDEPMMNSFSVDLGEMCVPQILLHRLKFFSLAEQNYSIAASLVYYIKSKTKWAELRIFRARIEFTTEKSLFTQKNVEEDFGLAEKSRMLENESRSDEISLKMQEL